MPNPLLPPEERHMTPDQVEALDKRRDLGHTFQRDGGQRRSGCAEKRAAVEHVSPQWRAIRAAAAFFSPAARAAYGAPRASRPPAGRGPRHGRPPSNEVSRGLSGPAARPSSVRTERPGINSDFCRIC